MSARATRLLPLVFTVLFSAACAEELADQDLVRSISPAGAADAGRVADAGSPLDGGGAKSPDGGLNFAPFDNAIKTFIDTYNKSDAGAMAPIKGASAVIIDKQRLLHQQGYGDYKADRLYVIASASKILSVGVLMKLADEKKLDLSEPVSTYLGDWGESPVGAASVEQLVSNSSGMPSLAEIVGGMFATDVCQYREAGTLQECAQTLYKTKPPREPDTRFAYGGSQWQLAGAVAEVVSGKSWAQLVEETYVTPCKVPSLGYTNQFEKSALGYPNFFQGDKENLPTTENPSIEGGAYITAPDYAKLLQMHLNGGKCGNNRVLSEAAVKKMQEDRVASYSGMTGNPNLDGYGLGWWISSQGKFVADPGAYGAFPWIDNERGYAAMVIIEVTSAVGAQLVLTAAKPALDGVFDGQKKK